MKNPPTQLSLSTPGAHGFASVAATFARASRITVVTWCIDRKETSELLNALYQLSETTRLRVITNIPNRWPAYYKDDARQSAKEAIDRVLECLNPGKFRCGVEVFFNFRCHAKIVRGDDMAYVGSANFTSASKDNFEAGVIIENNEALRQIDDYVEELIASGITYYGLRQSSGARLLFSFAVEEPHMTEVLHDSLWPASRVDDRYVLGFDPKGISDFEPWLDSLMHVCSTLNVRDSDADRRVSTSCIPAIVASLGRDVNKILKASKLLRTNRTSENEALETLLSKRGGYVDEIVASCEYDELVERLNREKADIWTGAEEAAISLCRDLPSLRAAILSVLPTNPSIDNTNAR